MSTYLPRRNMLFIHSPYTASRAVSEYLIEHHGGKRVSTKMHMTQKETFAVLDGKAQLEAEEVDGVIKGGVALYRHRLLKMPLTFTTLRSPLDMLVTMWMKRSPEMSLEQYLREVYPQKEETSPDFDMSVELLKGVHKFLWYESLEEDLSEILGETVELPRVGVTEGKKKYLDYYDETTMKLALPYVEAYCEAALGSEATAGCVALDCKSRPKG